MEPKKILDLIKKAREEVFHERQTEQYQTLFGRNQDLKQTSKGMPSNQEYTKEKSGGIYTKEGVKNNDIFTGIEKEEKRSLRRAIFSLKPRVRIAPTGEHFYASGLVVRNMDDAASLLAQIRKFAGERVIFLAVDKDGRVVSIFSHTRGTKKISLLLIQ